MNCVLSIVKKVSAAIARCSERNSMDVDGHEFQQPQQLNDSVYEFRKPDVDFDLEVVAFHGLRFRHYRNAYETTWQYEEDGIRCWLRDYLGKELPRARILSVSYDSCAQVHVYLDTPHGGSSLGDYLRNNRRCKGPVLEYLNEASFPLEELNREFDSLAVEREWKLLFWWYHLITQVWDTLDLPGRGLEVVKEESARGGQDFIFYQSRSDHSGKAFSNWSRDIEAYSQHVVGILRETITETIRLNDSVYQFHKPDGDFNLEVVAFHGLGYCDLRDAYETTWQYNDNGIRCWLRDVLAKELPGGRILSVSYDSCAQISSQDIGQKIVEDLIHLAEVGQEGCPVVLIGYCIGGLVMKKLCIEAENQCKQAPDGSSKRRLDSFLTNVRAHVFLDPPPADSILEDYLRNGRHCIGPMLEYLNEASPPLRELNSKFDSLAKERDWESSFCWCGIRWTSQSQASRWLKRSLPEEDKEVFHVVDLLQNIATETISGTSETTASIINVQTKPMNSSLYEMYRPGPGREVKLELIFFPGSLHNDSYKSTWMAEDGTHCWLQTWLPEVYPSARILAREGAAETILHSHLILVGHCFGGLIIKEFVCSVENKISTCINPYEYRRLQAFWSSVRGVASYGTSQSGYSSDDVLGRKDDEGNWRSQFSYLKMARLVNIYKHFSDFTTYSGWKELALGETRPTQLDKQQSKIIVVDKSCASKGIQRNSFFPIAGDHFTICKPKNPSSNSFLYLKHFIYTAKYEAQYRNMNVLRKRLRGTAIIITMNKGKKEDRVGSDFDRLRMKGMAEYLKFLPRCIDDEEAEEFPSVVKNILEKNVKDEDECLLCYVSAHGAVVGGKQVIFDKEERSIDLLSGIFQPIFDCPRLAGKPKVLVVNACRQSMKEDMDKDGRRTLVEVRHGKGTNTRVEEDLTGNVDDCLLVYSTELGTKSWRDLNGYDKGALFIKEMTDHVTMSYLTEDVRTIFEKIKLSVDKLAGSFGEAQTAVIYSTLSKRLSWGPR
ncbi:hypothetical protein R1flu_002587 [Riccia fluitans]|uniref:Caspase family p20 domain-containing protein n=1 Tax=Riccia fluitans TaxID=41844 RepID=A0ABD1Y9W3_9MARC